MVLLSHKDKKLIVIMDPKTELSCIFKYANKYSGSGTWGKELEDMLLSRLGIGVEFIVAYILSRIVQFRKKLVMPLINRWIFIDSYSLWKMWSYILDVPSHRYWNREEFKGIHYLEIYLEKCGTVSKTKRCC